MMRSIYLLCVFVVMVLSAPAYATKYVQWTEGNEVIIPVFKNLPEDKKIKFPEPVALGVTSAFKQHYRYQNIGTVVYLRPKNSEKTPSAIRIMAKGQKTANTYIMVIKKSSNNLDAEPVEVLVAASSSGAARGVVKNPLLVKRQEITPVELVRYASQQLYAPQYAIEQISGVKVAPLDSSESYDFIYPGNELQLRAVAAFTSGRYTVTALSAKNKSLFVPVTVDVPRLSSRINAVASSNQHSTLGITQQDNQTAIYVVTIGPLRTNLKVGGLK